MAKKVLGLIGKPLTHSFSKKYFTQKFQREQITDFDYQNFELQQIDDLRELLQNNPDIVGLNVTIPYKEQVLKFVDYPSKDVQDIGATNTLFIDHHKKIWAYNTDVYGFTESLKPFLKPIHKKALILGTGGAAKAVAYALKQLGIDVLFVSRYPKKVNHISYNDIHKDLLNTYLLVINTTPLGTFPNTNESPDFPYDFITPKHIFYDLIYNPAETVFLKNASNYGAVVSNGLKMLQLQAEESWKIWSKKTTE
jgi:shikimate dehydrogenase